MFETTISEGVLQVRREGMRWLSTGFDGGTWETPVAYNISVPEGWDRRDLSSYVTERKQQTGFEMDGPALLTGVELAHARGARQGPVEVYATAGISNPAALPMDDDRAEDSSSERADAGTVNLIVGTDRALGAGALANLLAVVAEAKAATLLAETGFPGTTTDAVIVGCDPAGDPAEYSGSATAVGAAARACTRDALQAALRSRYPDGEYPETVEAAEHGVRTDHAADVFRL